MGHFSLYLSEESFTLENLQGVTSSLLEFSLIIVGEFISSHHSVNKIKLQYEQAKALQVKNMSSFLSLRKVSIKLLLVFGV